MIWGDVINQVRSLHLEMISQIKIDPTLILESLSFQNEPFSFPKPSGNFNDWIPLPVPEILEFHPVERFLIEGPLLPMDEFQFQNETEAAMAFQQIFELEKKWLQALQINSDAFISELEKFWKNEWLKFKNKVGYSRLRAV